MPRKDQEQDINPFNSDYVFHVEDDENPFVPEQSWRESKIPPPFPKKKTATQPIKQAPKPKDPYYVYPGHNLDDFIIFCIILGIIMAIVGCLQMNGVFG